MYCDSSLNKQIQVGIVGISLSPLYYEELILCWVKNGLGQKWSGQKWSGQKWVGSKMGQVKNGRVKIGQVKNGRVKNDLIPLALLVLYSSYLRIY